MSNLLGLSQVWDREAKGALKTSPPLFRVATACMIPYKCSICYKYCNVLKKYLPTVSLISASRFSVCSLILLSGRDIGSLLSTGRSVSDLPISFPICRLTGVSTRLRAHKTMSPLTSNTLRLPLSWSIWCTSPFAVTF